MPVARAKRTDRAAARRRYRATIEAEGPDTEDVPEAAPARPSTRDVTTQVRVGFVRAFREAYHPVHVREDLAALPSLVRNKAFWIPLLVTIVASGAVVATGGRDAVSAILFSYFVQTPAIGGVFLAGFLAPRASWLLGAIIGFVAAGGYIAVLGLVPASLSGANPDPGTFQSIVLSALLFSPLMGAFFASTAAWYRRFLTLTNPNRGRRPQQPQKRQGDGRTRGAPPKGTAKAAARR